MIPGIERASSLWLEFRSFDQGDIWLGRLENLKIDDGSGEYI